MTSEAFQDPQGGWTVPSVFDGYCLVRLLGAGGMGKVFLAHDEVLDRPVAIKFLAASHPDAVARKRFLNEARAVARLQHPCIVAVHRAGEIDGRPFLVSEYIDGESLDRLSLPIPWEEALRIGVEVARGLAAAHRAGLVHRDIKPANVMRARDGSIKVLDFGIARVMNVPGSPEGHGDVADFRDRMVEEEGAGLLEDQCTRPVPTASRHHSEEVPVVLPIASGPGGPPTSSGRMMGTPAYMAPEVLRGEPATPAADVYSLGALLFTLCVGRPPSERMGGIRAVAAGSPCPSLAEVVPGIPAPFAEVVDRCLRSDPSERHPTASEVRADLVRVLEAPSRVETVIHGPYRGLRPFEAEHAGFFFGREGEIAALLDRLGRDSLVLVTGDSGVGKSSLCRAGVLPRIGARLDPALRWVTCSLVPGGHPVRGLCDALSQATGMERSRLEASLEDGAEGLGRLFRRERGDLGLVLLIDQLEEAVTLSDPGEADTLFRLLRWIADGPRGFKALATVRADFLGRVASEPTLGDILNRTLYFVRPLSPERIREAITAPLERVGFVFETPALVETLVRSAAETEGGLPLLQFTLERLWEMRDATCKVLREASLKALGGVEGALGRHGDEVLASMPPDRRQAARRILLRLVTPMGTRARESREDLCQGRPVLEAALETMVQARLLVARDGPEGDTLIEIAHEALIRGWNTLQRWLAEQSDTRITLARLREAASEWDRSGRPRDLLWSRALLKRTQGIDPGDLDPREVAFLRSSRRAFYRSLVVRFGLLGVFAVVLMATVGVMRLKTAWETHQRIQERIEAGQAWMRAGRETRDRLKVLQAEAFASFDQGDVESGEARWRHVLEVRQTVRRVFQMAEREFEGALLLDPQNQKARQMATEAVFQRALFAESIHEPVEDHLERLGIFDLSGGKRAYWSRPGQVVLRTPPGASVQLERFVRDPSGQAVLEPVETSEGALERGMDLPPGSYRAWIRAPGRVETVLPFLVQRDEGTVLEVVLPLLEAAPPGLLYIAGGRTLVGSADEDAIRRGFFHAPPIHPVEVRSFWIGRHEVTFGQWIEYLEALNPRERERRLPQVGLGGFEGALSLTRQPDGVWHLRIRPTIREHEVIAGQPVRYEGRTSRGDQDWLRMPVVGVTAEDAAEYAAWLHRTGRIPGARLCTEWEWERAARGADDRPYPHGWSLEPEDANHDETYRKIPSAMGPDEVGSHPRSRSPFGVEDLAGNVWEWTISMYGPPRHAARGGSFYFDANTLRTYNRETPEPAFRDVSVGFRVCADAPQG